MRIIFNSLIIFLVITLMQCQKKNTDPKILTGWLTKDQLLQEFDSYKEEMDLYQSDETIIDMLKELRETYEISIFLGTYCPDCKREVPRFFKILDQLDNDIFKYKLFGLDRKDKDKTDMREKYNIEFIPTFIVYHNEQEIGRIIERPLVSVENDLLEICSTVEQK